MTKAIVMNTRRAAVTEWDVPFTSVSGQHAGGAKLFLLGGDVDDGAQIAARVMLPETEQGTPHRKRAPAVYFSLSTPADTEALALVKADGEEYEYELYQRDDGTARAKPGLGINAHRIGFGYANLDGNDFRIDSIDAPLFEGKRRLP